MCSSNKFWQYASNSKLPGVGKETRTSTCMHFAYSNTGKELETLMLVCSSPS